MDAYGAGPAAGATPYRLPLSDIMPRLERFSHAYMGYPQQCKASDKDVHPSGPAPALA